MKDIESILGDEKIIHKLYDDDAIIRYIKSFDNVLYADYSYDAGGLYECYNSLIGLLAYHKDNKYLFAEFGYFKENRYELKLIINDYPEYITADDYELTGSIFNDFVNQHNISIEQFNTFITEGDIENIKCSALKKMTLDEYREVFPHRYVNNRIKYSIENKKYKRVYIDNLSEDLIYRCPYCGACSFSKIINNNINNLKEIDINELYDDIDRGLYLCHVCGLISRSPDNIMDYI